MPLKTFKHRPTEIKALQFEGTMDSVMELIEAFPFSLAFLKRVYKVEFGEDYEDQGEFLSGIGYSPKEDGGYELTVPTHSGWEYANTGDWLIWDEGGVSRIIREEVFELIYE